MNAPVGGITKTTLKSKLDVSILNNFLRATRKTTLKSKLDVSILNNFLYATIQVIQLSVCPSLETIL